MATDPIADLQSQISDLNVLVTQLRRTQASSPTTTTTTTAAATTSSGGSITFLSTPVVVWADNGAVSAINWTTFDCTNYISSSSSVVLLEVSGVRDASVTGLASAWGRNNSTTPQLKIYSSNSSGVDVDTEGSLGHFFLPSSARTFDWMKENGVRGFNIRLIGYM